MQWGGWLTWWLYPHGGKVFIDGRDVGNVYTPSDLVAYRRLLLNPEAFEKESVEQKWDAIALELSGSLTKKPALGIKDNEKWSIGYLDDSYVVFVPADKKRDGNTIEWPEGLWRITKQSESRVKNPQRHLGMALSKLENDAEAAIAFKKGLEVMPDDFLALSFLGMHSLNQTNLEDAVQFLSRAVLMKPDHFASHQNLAVAYMMSGNVLKAIHHGEEAVTYWPEDPVAWLNLAQYYAASGNKAQADRCNRIARVVEKRALPR